jgi:hypothetical protein
VLSNSTFFNDGDVLIDPAQYGSHLLWHWALEASGIKELNYLKSFHSSDLTGHARRCVGANMAHRLDSYTWSPDIPSIHFLVPVSSLRHSAQALQANRPVFRSRLCHLSAMWCWFLSSAITLALHLGKFLWGLVFCSWKQMAWHDLMCSFNTWFLEYLQSARPCFGHWK